MISRNTKQKKLIEDSVIKMPEFFHAEDLFNSLRESDDSISLATIYRNLKQLSSEQKIFGYSCERRQVYAKKKQHCHFVDEDTNEVTHFEVDNLDFLKGKIPGSISSFSLEVRGKRN